MKDYKEYIERYFEGMLSEDEELELKLFLTSEEGQGPEYDEDGILLHRMQCL